MLLAPHAQHISEMSSVHALTSILVVQVNHQACGTGPRAVSDSGNTAPNMTKSQLAFSALPSARSRCWQRWAFFRPERLRPTPRRRGSAGYSAWCSCVREFSSSLGASWETSMKRVPLCRRMRPVSCAWSMTCCRSPSCACSQCCLPGSRSVRVRGISPLQITAFRSRHLEQATRWGAWHSVSARCCSGASSQVS